MDKEDTRTTTEILDELRLEMCKHPVYLSGDDDLTNSRGIVHTATLFIGRLTEDMHALKDIVRDLQNGGAR